MSFKLIWQSRTKNGKGRAYSERWTSGAKAYIRGYHLGESYFESLQTSSRSIAAKKFAARQKQIHDEAEKIEDGSSINFAAAVKLYFGTSNPEERDPTNRVSKIFDKFWERKLTSIKQADLDALAKELYPNAGPQTLNREVYTPFVAVYNAAADADKVLKRQWRRPVGHDRVKPVNPPTDAEIASLVAAATRVAGRGEWERARNKAAIYCYTLTGDRTGPIINLRWPDVSFPQNTIYFAETKNGESRTVLMPPLLRETLEALKALKRQERKSPRRKKARKVDDLVFGWETRAGPSRMIARARAIAGLPEVRPHDVGRHAFGRRVRQKLKMDRAELKKAGNWKSDKAVERYDHMALDTIKERVRDVDTSELAGAAVKQ